jgi:DNA-binding transcriptional MerR regulator/methylmalonyl-CoA mutase cobalamin-binding subunit
MSDSHYSIKAVAKITGLTPHAIRVWEKRYGAVKPLRSGTNRRTYTGAEVERLVLLRRAISGGHNIGNIATLPDERLQELVVAAEASPGPVASANSTEDFAANSLESIRALNTRQFEEVLTRAILAYGQHGLLERLIGPLVRQIGELWRDGSITAAHEHFASAVIRNFLVRNYKPFAYSHEMPTLVVATPAGQLHELGAVMVAAAANDLGWRVIYLGTSLPAAEIAGAAAQNHARAVALSIVYPEDDPSLHMELRNLRNFLPNTRIIVGGRAAAAYEPTLVEIDAFQTRDLSDLYGELDRLRKTPPPSMQRPRVPNGTHHSPHQTN